jgi:predicted ATP-dependent protease
VARVVEHTARLAGDAEKLSVHMRPVLDLLREADLCAGEAGRAVVSAEDVQAAIDAQLRRAGRVRERLLEAVRRQIILIDTSGEKTTSADGSKAMSSCRRSRVQRRNCAASTSPFPLPLPLPFPFPFPFPTG